MPDPYEGLEEMSSRLGFRPTSGSRGNTAVPTHDPFTRTCESFWQCQGDVEEVCSWASPNKDKMWRHLRRHPSHKIYEKEWQYGQAAPWARIIETREVDADDL